MKQKLKWDEAAGCLFFAASVVMLAVSVYLCRGEDIWYDELFTMGFAVRPMSELISLTARDVHPPLYYLIVHIFVKLGGASLDGQVFMAKLSSVVPFFLCAVLALTKVKRSFGMLTAGLFSFCMLGMAQLAPYTVEIRMYGYALFFVTLCMMYAWELTSGKVHEMQKEPAAAKEDELNVSQRLRSLMGLTVCAVCACYTHYFACVAAMMIYGYLLTDSLLKLKKKKIKISAVKGWLISGLITAAAYLPWLVKVVSSQLGKVSENYWIPPVSLRTLGGCVEFVFKPMFADESLNAVLAVLFFGIYGVLLLKALFQKERTAVTGFAAGCVSVLIGLILFGMAVSVLIRPLFVYRYMIPALGVFWLAFGVLISRLKEQKTAVIIVLLFVGILGIRNYRAFYGEEMWKQVQLVQTKEALSQVEKEDVLLANFDHVQGVAAFYLENESYLWYGSPETLVQEMFPETHPLVEGTFSDEEGIARIKEFLDANKQVWFLGSGNAREEILEKWQEAGISSKECASVLLERYWFNLYEISYD